MPAQHGRRSAGNEMMQRIEEINRVSLVEPKRFWSTHGAAGFPVVIENSVPTWRTTGDWSIAYLREKVGHRRAALNRGYFDKSPSRPQAMADIFDAIECGSPLDGHQFPYLRNIDVWNDLPELVADLSPRFAYIMPNWMTCRLLPRHVPDGLVEFFLGGPGASFPKLHIDTHGTHAFITQLLGTKHVVVAPPWATESLRSEFGDPEKFSLNVGKSKWVEMGVTETTLYPGDTLFVPAGWWHTTYITEISISVSSNCVNATNWPNYVSAVTRHTPAIKKPMKRLFLSAVGLCLRLADKVGFRGLYRRLPSSEASVGDLRLSRAS